MATINQADNYVKSANDYINKWSFFLTKRERYEKAVDLLNKSAPIYKVNNQMGKAIDCYCKIHDLCLEIDSKYEACQALEGIGKIYKKYDNEKAIYIYERIVKILIPMNKLSHAAKLLDELAMSLQENNVEQHSDKILDLYFQAKRLYLSDHKTYQANKIMLKIADLLMSTKKYDKASDIFENMAKIDLITNEWSSKKWFFKALLCRLVFNDANEVLKKCSEYTNLCPLLHKSKELEFLQNIIQTLNESDIDKFTDICTKYDRTTSLEDVMVTILLDIKKRMGNSRFE